MDTNEIIRELQAHGLDPSCLDSTDPGRFDQDCIKMLLDTLASKGKDPEAQAWLASISEALNRADAPHASRDFDKKL